MTGFLSASLFVLAGCAVLGTIPPSILAARAHGLPVAVLTLLIAAFVVYVLIVTATNLRYN